MKKADEEAQKVFGKLSLLSGTYHGNAKYKLIHKHEKENGGAIV